MLTPSSPRSSPSSHGHLQPWTLTCLRVPKCCVLQRFTQYAEQFEYLLRIHHLIFGCTCFWASRNDRTSIKNRAVVSLSCGENGITHVQVSYCRYRVHDGKDEGLVIPPRPSCPLVSLSDIYISLVLPFPCFLCMFLFLSPSLGHSLSLVPTDGCLCTWGLFLMFLGFACTLVQTTLCCACLSPMF